jgi:hypothetical protein
MDLSYTVHRAPSPLAGPDACREHVHWKYAACAGINSFRWTDSGHRPETRVRLLWSDTHLAVRFDVSDRYVRSVAERFQDPVCQDSCVELFVAPGTADCGYFNVEINAGGTMLLGYGDQRHDRQPVSEPDAAAIVVSHSLPQRTEPEITVPCQWSIEYHVPFSLFADYAAAPAPGTGTVWKGNFYKCGDHTSHPHWGSWAPVETPAPDFHRPEFFAPLIFANQQEPC